MKLQRYFSPQYMLQYMDVQTAAHTAIGSPLIRRDLLSGNLMALPLQCRSDRDKVAVVDVRDEDFYGGHIKGSLNIPAGEFNEDAGVDNAIDQLPKAVNTCVVHCMLSQVRGPRSAGRCAVCTTPLSHYAFFYTSLQFHLLEQRDTWLYHVWKQTTGLH